MKLIAGIMLILISVVHVLYGEKQQVNVLKKLKADSILIGSFRTMSLQGGLLLFGVGVVEIMTYTRLTELHGFAAFIPVGIICLNVLSVFIIAILKHKELFKVIIPQLIIFTIIITLQLISVI